MQEFLLLIRSEGECADHMTQEQHQAHFNRVVSYINDLRTSGKLISAQPLTMRGSMLQRKGGSIKDGPFIESKEVIGGYFLFTASNYDEAMEIARAHPLLSDDETSRLELREIKMEEGINC